MKSTLSLYEIDYQLWLEKTIAQLQAHDFSHIDFENLIEEIKSLGKRDKRAIYSYMMRLCEHLLKVKYWEQERENCLRGWKLEIRNFRLQIQLIIKDSPSLKSYLQENFALQYENGRKLFLEATELESAMIPENPCFSLEQALEEDWLP